MNNIKYILNMAGLIIISKGIFNIIGIHIPPKNGKIPHDWIEYGVSNILDGLIVVAISLSLRDIKNVYWYFLIFMIILFRIELGV